MNRDAYLILCHDKPGSLKALCQYLEAAGHDIYLHPDAHSQLANQLYTSPQVQIIPKPIPVKWADWSMVEATLKLMEAAQSSKKNYRYIHLISGACLPAMPIEQLDKELDSSIIEQKLWIECEPLPRTFWGEEGGQFRVQIWFPRFMVNKHSKWHHYFWSYIRKWKRLKIKRLAYKKHAPYYGGAQWWSLPSNAVAQLLKTHHQNKQLSKFYQHSFCSDELYIQHLLMKAGLSAQLAGSNRRYLSWEKPDSPSPQTLEEKHWPSIKNSGAFFARKFNLSEEETRRYLKQL